MGQTEMTAAPFTFTVTEEAHEEPCEFLEDTCRKVAVWRGRLPGMPCAHNVRMYCDPHKEVLAAWDREDHGPWQWQCYACRACGPGPILWSRP